MAVQTKQINQLLANFQNKKDFAKDIADAKSLVQNLFYERYVQTMETNFKNYQEAFMADPPKEVHLLQSMKQFAPPEKHPSMDRAINTMMVYQSLLPLQQTVRLQAKDNGDQSLHADGVYDIDPSCLGTAPKVQPSPPMLLLCMLLLCRCV